MSTDTGVYPREQCVLRYLLEARAAATPDKTYVALQDGSTLSYGDFHARVRAAASGLARLGVAQGDHVVVWLPTGLEGLTTWFAINYLGAVYVPLNIAYRGGILEHALNLSDAKLAVIHGDLASRLTEIPLASLRDVVVLHDRGVQIAGLATHPFSLLEHGEGRLPELAAPIEPWDTHAIIFTSGTTGPSKGVLQSYMHLYNYTMGYTLATAADRFLVSLPLFHVGGTSPRMVMLTRGGSIALMEAFSTDSFWEVVHRTQSTTTILLGVMASFLNKLPAPPDGIGKCLKWVSVVPLDEEAIAFGKRFNITIKTGFNMTEAPSPLVSEPNPTAIGSAGRPRAGIECRIVDAHDCEVAVGDIGELIVSSDRPWALNHGYYKNPQATVEAWRNGWFHTGDGFRRDEQGNYYFVDRIKDAIRRRGENISSFEVEAEVLKHPMIREAAAVAVKSDVAEDEVMVAVSLAPGAEFDPAELIHFLQPRMAHFMIPRYVRVLPDLPKTPTSKVQKHLLRSAGVTPDAWDREAAGIRIRRERLGDG
ncbi:ATP-dependent acyl-CoA ligase [Camelimonas fluminis]|uniref:AMP-binding protein n=1 Tax=Camelimonas fluminis TaxID=1576911 RepID=A0ABV7UKZ7_9HYPH|nr:AMP-binding protein [Camelimonas fluminis]GHE61352.1 ATP-dependent acyl-CoA ligase [Camelimonas fluminis]